MTHPYFHAESSARIWGGKAEDYEYIHAHFDRYKEHFADFRHRLMTHHAEGIYAAERELGTTITNSDGKKVPVKYLLEQHTREDCGGRIPTLADWLKHVNPQSWMARAFPLLGKGARGE